MSAGKIGQNLVTLQPLLRRSKAAKKLAQAVSAALAQTKAAITCDGSVDGLLAAAQKDEQGVRAVLEAIADEGADEKVSQLADRALSVMLLGAQTKIGPIKIWPAPIIRQEALDVVVRARSYQVAEARIYVYPEILSGSLISYSAVAVFRIQNSQVMARYFGNVDGGEENETFARGRLEVVLHRINLQRIKDENPGDGLVVYAEEVYSCNLGPKQTDSEIRKILWEAILLGDLNKLPKTDLAQLATEVFRLIPPAELRGARKDAQVTNSSPSGAIDAGEKKLWRNDNPYGIG